MSPRKAKTHPIPASTPPAGKLRAESEPASAQEAGAEAGKELARGLAADRADRERRTERVRQGLERARRLEKWGGRLLTAGGIGFYLLFPCLIPGESLFGIHVTLRTWLLAFGADFTAIVLGGLLIFLAQRFYHWLERWAEAHSIEV